MSAKGFKLIGQEEETVPPTADPAAHLAAQDAEAKAAAQHQQAMQILVLALATVSKRFVIALGNLVSLVLAASVLLVWLRAPDPTVHQLVSLGMYSAFVLAAIFITRRMK